MESYIALPDDARDPRKQSASFLTEFVILPVMKRWNIFFGGVTFIIMTTMFMPGLLGMHQYTQWGGMYTDGWCSVYVRQVKIGTENDSEPVYKEESFQGPSTRNVWFTPMHNSASCFAWAQSWCGKQRIYGWKILTAQAYFREHYLEDGLDTCSIPPLNPPWFIQNPS